MNYNGRVHLEKYFARIYSTRSATHDVIVADNLSTDDSLQYLKDNYSELRIIELKKNHGFAGGYEMALNKIKGEYDYYQLINSDLELTDNWSKDILLEMEKDPSLAAAQPKIKSLQEKNKFEYAGASGGFIDKYYYPFCRGRILSFQEEDNGQYDSISEVFWATGCALVIRANLYHSIGGLDPKFFAHQEEIDLCWRLKRAGYKIKVFPNSTVYHLGGGTLAYGSPFKTYLNFRNSLYMIFKNLTGLNLIRAILARLILDGIAGFHFLITGKPMHCWMVFKSHLRFYISIPKLSERKSLESRLIQDVAIGEANLTGKVNRSIIYNFYLKGKKTYNEILKKS